MTLCWLTLVEWKTCFEILLKIDQQDQENVDQAMNQLYKQLGDQAETIFKTITSDNGSEFAGIYEMLREDRKSTRLNSSHVSISYAVFCLKKKIKIIIQEHTQ